jgi:hypothetical protein
MWFAAVPLLFAFLSGWALVLSWKKVTLGPKIGGVLLTLTFVAAANSVVALNLPDDLYGGDPGIGKVVDGHYFVGNHGRFTEVSEGTFRGLLLYQHVSGYVLAACIVSTAIAIWIRSLQAKSKDLSGADSIVG